MKLNTGFLVKRQGAVLIIVLWISTGLVSMALLFGHSVMLDYRAASYVEAGIQSEQTMEGAIQYISYVLENLETPGALPSDDDYVYQNVGCGDSYFWLIGRDVNDEYTDTTPVYGLVDENAKINLNTATVEMLEALPHMTREFAAAIIDWRDEDSEVTENGAEDRAYSSRTVGYQVKNAPFESIYELKWVRGADEELLFGEDVNLNGVLDRNENDGNVSYPPDNRNGKLDRGILDYVTVFSREPGISEEDSSRVNINGDEEEALSELLQNTFSEDRVREIEQQVDQEDDYESLLEFYIRSGMTAEEFEPIESSLTTTDDEYVYGLINVNTACKDVLMCLPGIDETKAQALISHRTGNQETSHTMTWVAEVLEEEEALEIGPYITGRSYQFMLDIAATNLQFEGYRRSQVILDISEEEAHVIYRRDMTGSGWALGQRFTETDPRTRR